MIRKLVKQMLSAQIFSALAVSLCLLIDIVVIGRYLGDEAMAAYQMSNPLLLSIGALGTLLSAGVQVAYGKSLGSGSKEETNKGYSSAIAVAAALLLKKGFGVEGKDLLEMNLQSMQDVAEAAEKAGSVKLPAEER